MANSCCNPESAGAGQRQRLADPELVVRGCPGDWQQILWAALSEAAVILLFIIALVHDPDRRRGLGDRDAPTAVCGM